MEEAMKTIKYKGAIYVEAGAMKGHDPAVIHILSDLLIKYEGKDKTKGRPRWRFVFKTEEGATGFCSAVKKKFIVSPKKKGTTVDF